MVEGSVARVHDAGECRGGSVGRMMEGSAVRRRCGAVRWRVGVKVVGDGVELGRVGAQGRSHRDD